MNLICMRCLLWDVAAFDDVHEVDADASSGVFSCNFVKRQCL